MWLKKTLSVAVILQHLLVTTLWATHPGDNEPFISLNSSGIGHRHMIVTPSNGPIPHILLDPETLDTLNLQLSRQPDLQLVSGFFESTLNNRSQGWERYVPGGVGLTTSLFALWATTVSFTNNSVVNWVMHLSTNERAAALGGTLSVILALPVLAETTLATRGLINWGKSLKKKHSREVRQDRSGKHLALHLTGQAGATALGVVSSFVAVQISKGAFNYVAPGGAVPTFWHFYLTAPGLAYMTLIEGVNSPSKAVNRGLGWLMEGDEAKQFLLRRAANSYRHLWATEEESGLDPNQLTSLALTLEIIEESMPGKDNKGLRGLLTTYLLLNEDFANDKGWGYQERGSKPKGFKKFLRFLATDFVWNPNDSAWDNGAGIAGRLLALSAIYYRFWVWQLSSSKLANGVKDVPVLPYVPTSEANTLGGIETAFFTTIAMASTAREFQEIMGFLTGENKNIHRETLMDEHPRLGRGGVLNRIGTSGLWARLFATAVGRLLTVPQMAQVMDLDGLFEYMSTGFLGTIPDYVASGIVFNLGNGAMAANALRRPTAKGFDAIQWHHWFNAWKSEDQLLARLRHGLCEKLVDFSNLARRSQPKKLQALATSLRWFDAQQQKAKDEEKRRVLAVEMPAPALTREGDDSNKIVLVPKTLPQVIEPEEDELQQDGSPDKYTGGSSSSADEIEGGSNSPSPEKKDSPPIVSNKALIPFPVGNGALVDVAPGSGPVIQAMQRVGIKVPEVKDANRLGILQRMMEKESGAIGELFPEVRVGYETFDTLEEKNFAIEIPGFWSRAGSGTLWGLGKVWDGTKWTTKKAGNGLVALWHKVTCYKPRKVVDLSRLREGGELVTETEYEQYDPEHAVEMQLVRKPVTPSNGNGLRQRLLPAN